jgi:hypothetical protein
MIIINRARDTWPPRHRFKCLEAPMPTAPHHNAAGRQCRRQYSQCREPFPGRSSTGRPLHTSPGCIVGATLPLCCWTLCTHAPDVCRFHRRSVVAIAVLGPVRQCTLPEPATGSTTGCRILPRLTAVGTLRQHIRGLYERAPPGRRLLPPFAKSERRLVPPLDRHCRRRLSAHGRQY